MPSCAAIPNWCIRLKPPRTSHTVEMLAMDAPENRIRSTVQAVKYLPVGATPANSPRQVPEARRPTCRADLRVYAQPSDYPPRLLAHGPGVRLAGAAGAQ